MAAFEVAQAISSCPGVIEVNVYGVEIPGYDGRAGMAALVVDEPFDLATLRRHINARLPDYARPLFLRISESLEITETFKHKKHKLATQGFDPHTISDTIYCVEPQRDTYIRMDESIYQRIRCRLVSVVISYGTAKCEQIHPSLPVEYLVLDREMHS